MWEKIRESLNVTKVQSHMCWYYTMWEWYHQVWEKIKEPLNVTKVHSHVMLVLHNVKIVSSNVRKNKGTAEYDKSIITGDVSIYYTIWGWYNQMWCFGNRV